RRTQSSGSSAWYAKRGDHLKWRRPAKEDWRSESRGAPCPSISRSNSRGSWAWTARIVNGSSLVYPFDNEDFTIRVIPAHGNPERRDHKSLYISANSLAVPIINDLINCRLRTVTERDPLSIRDSV